MYGSVWFFCTVIIHWACTVVGLVAIGLLLFEDIIPYYGQDSAPKRYLARQIHRKCYEASGVLSICSVLFVFGLPHCGFNISTLAKLLGGPSLFHLVIAITYFKFQESCVKQPEQQHQVSPGVLSWCIAYYCAAFLVNDRRTSISS